jgi:uncharacterized iron-regulated protein
MKTVLSACFVALAGMAGADVLPGDAVAAAALADVVILGEVHDNPHHHLVQAEMLRRLSAAGRAPGAVIYEMLTEDQANAVTPDLVADPVAMERALGWADSGWPDFAMYHPIFAALPEVPVRGAAVPRAETRAVMEAGLAGAFGPNAALYGLDRPLPEEDQDAREVLQHAAHCEALPADMLPVMVDIQRLRDARLAQVALAALDEHGAPVVVITGNGHARTDWGVPAALALVRPGLRVFTVLQGEEGGAPEGGGDLSLTDAPAPERDDPCAAFAR